ncbi:MAG: hypothetical protein K2X66_05260 [Cyanobacteria bacterium]|nr:hypothetical protein [Cyanobacteriota bacterium]
MDLVEFTEPSYFLLFGPSGAGLTSTLNTFSDFGYIVVGDVPIEDFLNVFKALTQTQKRIAFSLKLKSPMDLASGLVNNENSGVDALKNIADEIQKFFYPLDPHEPPLKVLYLNAPESTLIQRYLHTEKRHPFQEQGLEKGIKAEKLLYEILQPLKNYEINTLTTPLNEIRFKISKIIGIDIERKEFSIHLNSFGFQYGIPQDSELLFDMRFLDNPFYKESLRPLTGLDQPVIDYIFSAPISQPFLMAWSQLIQMLLPHYHEQGKTRLTISIGCTGGQHRSVCMTEALGKSLNEAFKAAQCDYTILVHHREMARWPKNNIATPPKTNSDNAQTLEPLGEKR